MFTGLSAFPLTPADADGVVQVDELQALVSRLEGSGVTSVGLLGSTGTYMFLDRGQRMRAITAAREVLTDLPLIVGVGAMRTDEAVTLAQDAEGEGADALLMAPVSYNPLTEEEVFQHYSAVAAATELSICIYNNPGTTSFAFSDDLLVRLSKIENFKAVKMPLVADDDFAGELARLRGVLPEGFEVGYSGDWGMADALQGGAKAFYSSIAGTMVEPLVKLSNACFEGDAQTVGELNSRLEPLWALCKMHGSLRVAQCLAQEMGLVTTSLPRPLLGLPEGDMQALRDFLSDLI